jgi:hypothetical protein
LTSRRFLQGSEQGQFADKACTGCEQADVAHTSEASLVARVLASVRTEPIENDTLVLLFHRTQVHESVISSLRDPYVLEADVTPTYGYAIVQCKLRDQDYELLRHMYLDVMSVSEFKKWRIQHHKATKTSGVSAVTELRGLTRMEMPTRCAADGLPYNLAKSSGVKLSVYQVRSSEAYSYWTVSLGGSAQCKRCFIQEANNRGVKVLADEDVSLNCVGAFI